MALSIESDEADRLAREMAVETALRERPDRDTPGTRPA
jgi:hypothetical protein